jgi:hypothetical protein
MMKFGLSAYGRGKIIALAVFVPLVVQLSGGCSTYHRRSVEIKQSFTDTDYAHALERIEKIDRGSSELLYLYEKGLILHYSDRFAESNEAFERSEMLLEELYTKSVSRELAALVVTDNIARYRGTSYEAILVNYYKILNYLLMNDLDGALVECRRVNRKLEFLRDTEGVFFANDPFIQYLTGMVYAAAGDLNDADVSFRVAADEYEALAGQYGVEMPRQLLCDKRMAARLLGEGIAADSIEVYCPAMPDSGDGVLNLFLECGYVAHKQERKVVLPIFKDDDTSDTDALAEVLAAREGVIVAYEEERKIDYVLKIAVPAMVPTPVPWDYAVVRPVWKPVPVDAADDQRPDSSSAVDRGGERDLRDSFVRTDVVENVDSYALAAFEEEYGKIVFRTVARALAKYVAKEGASSKDEVLGWVVNWFNVATESADTREWTTLPEKILMARLALPAGLYDLDVELVDASGRTVDRLLIENLLVEPGRTSFVNHRIF